MESNGSEAEQSEVSPLTDKFLQAAFAGHDDLLEALLSFGISAGCCGRGGHSALLLACGEGHLRCAKMLLLAGARCDMVAAPHELPLFAAVRNGHADVALLLLKHGARADGAGADGVIPLDSIPLIAASALGHGPCVALLLAGGSPPDQAGEAGCRALHAAAWQDQTAIVLALLEGGGAVGAVDENGATPLHFAARYGHAATCALLIAWRAPLSIEDALGASPLLSALERGHRDVGMQIARALVARGGTSMDEVLVGLDGIARHELLLAGAGDSAPLPKGQAASATASETALAAADVSDAGATSAVDGAAAAQDTTAGMAGARFGHGDWTGGWEDGWAAQLSDRDEVRLPIDFASQAAEMPLYLRRLLVDNVPPSAASTGAFVRALRLAPALHAEALLACSRPAHSQVLHRKHTLSQLACTSLRAAVDEDAAPGAAPAADEVGECAALTSGVASGARNAGRSLAQDSVDGLPEHQLDLTVATLVPLIGAAGLASLRALPAAFLAAGGDDGRAAAAPALQIERCFVRRYTAAERPWFRFHTDTAALTANIALAADEHHGGGRLLALLGGGLRAIERKAGEATVHPSSLLHGVSRMRSGVRYSLIVFYAAPAG